GAVSAVKLNIVVAMSRHVPTRADGDDGAGMEFEHTMDRGRGANLDDAALIGALGGDDALAARHVGESREALDRAEQMHAVGDVIGTEIEDRPAARLEEEIRVRMPMLHAAAHHMPGAAHDLALLAA